jgi:hypothetical protein
MASVALAALAVAVLFVYHSYRQACLVLINEQSGQVLFCEPIGGDNEFALSFTHSVNQSMVTEYNKIKKGEIYLKSLRFYTFGAGMPSEVGFGQTMRYEEDGAMVIEGFARHMPRLTYNIGRTANHTLHWQGLKIPLNTLDAPGQPVLFYVK